jgi:CheY-like chemotaxis protein
LRGEHVALSVSDTGTGLSPETMGRVFEPFFTTKGYGEGTGLGLSQVFGFAKQIGGSVSVKSRLGEGSTFTIHLPASHATAQQAREHREHNGAAHGRVLVVEDDNFVAELAAGMLDELGFEPIVVHSAREALDRLTNDERPRMIFSDIVMPGGISGLELAQNVRRRFPELPILLTTGYSEHVGGTHGFEILQKPYDMGALAKALHVVLKEGIDA